MRRITLFLLAVFSAFVAKAQYEPQWQLSLPELENLNIITSKSFADGYALLGCFADTVSVGGVTINSQGGTDVLLLHLDTLGTVRRVLSIGDEYNNTASNLFNHNDTLFVCGQTASDSLNALFVYSFDVSFNQLSNLVLPFNGKIQTDILRVESGKILLGGSMKGSITTGSQSIVNDSGEQAFLIELSGGGDLVSSWQASGNGSHRLNSIVTKNNGDFVLLINTGKGTLEMPNESSLSFNGDGVVAVIYDSTWNTKSRCVFGCTGFVEAIDMIDNELGCVIGLNYNGTLTIGNQTFSSLGSLVSLLIQLDMEGNPIWINEIESDDYSRLLDIETEEGTIFCTGYYYGKLIVGEEIFGETIERNMFLLAFDNEGHSLWHIDMEGIGDNDMGQNIVCKHNTIMLNGASQTTKESNATGIVPANNKMSTFAQKLKLKKEDEEDMVEESMEEKIEMCDGIINQLSDHLSDNNLVFLVYPNPVKSMLHWCTNQFNSWMLNVYDAKGVLLAQKYYDNCTEGYLDFSICKSGIYIITLSSTEKSWQRVIIKD